MALVPPPATATMLKKKGIYMDILRKEYCTRRGSALEALFINTQIKKTSGLLGFLGCSHINRASTVTIAPS
jgi:uncharacterized protein (DUF111 family)